jgi:hypothetical protein
MNMERRLRWIDWVLIALLAVQLATAMSLVAGRHPGELVNYFRSFYHDVTQEAPSQSQPPPDAASGVYSRS